MGAAADLEEEAAREQRNGGNGGTPGNGKKNNKKGGKKQNDNSFIGEDEDEDPRICDFENKTEKACAQHAKEEDNKKKAAEKRAALEKERAKQAEIQAKKQAEKDAKELEKRKVLEATKKLAQEEQKKKQKEAAEAAKAQEKADRLAEIQSQQYIMMREEQLGQLDKYWDESHNTLTALKAAIEESLTEEIKSAFSNMTLDPRTDTEDRMDIACVILAKFTNLKFLEIGKRPCAHATSTSSSAHVPTALRSRLKKVREKVRSLVKALVPASEKASVSPSDNDDGLTGSSTTANSEVLLKENKAASEKTGEKKEELLTVAEIIATMTRSMQKKMKAKAAETGKSVEVLVKETMPCIEAAKEKAEKEEKAKKTSTTTVTTTSPKKVVEKVLSPEEEDLKIREKICELIPSEWRLIFNLEFPEESWQVVDESAQQAAVEKEKEAKEAAQQLAAGGKKSGKKSVKSQAPKVEEDLDALLAEFGAADKGKKGKKTNKK